MSNTLTLDKQQIAVLINNLDNERLKDALYWLELDLDAADIKIEDKEQIFKLCQMIQETIEYRDEQDKLSAQQRANQEEEVMHLNDADPLTGQPLARITYYGHTIYGKIGENLGPGFGVTFNLEARDGEFHFDPDLGDIVCLKGSWYFWNSL